MIKTILKHLPPIDAEATEKAVLELLEETLWFKVDDVVEDRREATITPAYVAREHGNTNQTSDQTASIAIHNAAQDEGRKRQIERVERAVYKLKPLQRKIITIRYLTSLGVTDTDTYNELEIGKTSYYLHRNEALYMLAFLLRIYVQK